MNGNYPKKLIKTDAALARLLAKEEKRQLETIDLIPSENFADPNVRALEGSVFMNKYSEGYSGRRYYPGNIVVDELENLAISRARKAFGLDKNWHVNVQPYSGSPANLAVYLGLLRPGEKILGMSLADGGHLTHGHKVNASGIIFKSIGYCVDIITGLIDYREIERLANKEKPRIVVSGLTAYPRRLDFKKFGQIAKKVGAYHLADISHISGLISAGLHPSPFPYADVVTTTTHKILRGPRGAVIFCKKELAEKIDPAVFPRLQGGPHDNTTAAVAYAFGQVATPRYRAYAKAVLENTKALSRVLIKEGFALATGGTDNHMLLLDLKPLGMSGMDGEKLLERAGIIANRNSLLGDAAPFRPSGIRMGAPAITTRGMKPSDMARIASWISRILIDHENPEKVGFEVRAFLKKFPIS